ncbi:MAG TPA: CDP-archaeol synthase, partial [Myxococcota bacterium]|nr:CDP-archaeol synthase [Myxococcota bacterium]
VYLAVVVLFVLQGQREFYRLIEDKGAQPLATFGMVAAVALCLVQYIGTEYHANLLMTATLLFVLVAQLGKAQITAALASISGTFFGVFYVGWLLSHAISLRNFHGAITSRYGEPVAASIGVTPECGNFLVFFTLFVVIWCDAAAYFGGRAYGKRKLAPAISPGKSVEGAIAGVVGGLLAAIVCKGGFDLLWPEQSALLSWYAAGVLALLLSAAGIIGDLIESLLKRDAEVKDTGHLLPGTGGVLDRIDSFLLAAPVMYYSMLFYVFWKVG